jgi:hypothetical protein
LEPDDDDDDTTGTIAPDLERLLAGTFALMTTWYRCPQPAICHKVLDNLMRIARHDMVSDPLRRVCANAAARWAGYLEEAELAIEDCDALDDEDDPREGGPPAGDGARGPATLH